MIEFFKSVVKTFTCNHQFDFHRVTSGDENNYSIPNRKVEKCNICNSFRYSEMTDEDWLRSDWELIGEDMRKAMGLDNK